MQLSKSLSTVRRAFFHDSPVVANKFTVQHLLTLPPRMAEEFENLEEKSRPEWFACADPAGEPLGSGAGTANLLVRAWQTTGNGESFEGWLRHSQKLIIHAGGQSRRLPAYATTGKMLLPMPVFRWSRGQRLDQTLLDLQLPDYERVLAHGGSQFVAMVTSGDVLLRFGRVLPPFPQVDVLGLGMWVSPETARHFGVFFTPRNQPGKLAFFLQKPVPGRIRELAHEHLALVDTGMWLLSERAVRVLMQKSGWDAARAEFNTGRPNPYELYAQFGLALGKRPTSPDPAVSQLTSAVVPLPEAEFYHFGTTAQLIDSISALQNLVVDASRLGLVGARRQTQQVNQNSRLQAALRREGDQVFWIENSVVPAGWQLADRHVLTGVPENDWRVKLEPEVCLDFVPVGDHDFCLRAYGFGDSFSGRVGQDSTTWFDRPLAEWFAARGLSPEPCGVQSGADVQSAPLFPVLAGAALDPEFLEWVFGATPAQRPDFAARWRELPRLSARQIPERANVRRILQQRSELRRACLAPLMKNFRFSVFFRLDLESVAKDFAQNGAELPDLPFEKQDDPMHAVHGEMFRSAVLRHRGSADWETCEAAAFGKLRERIMQEAQLSPVRPVRHVLEDQIVWARSPVRLDLAGGWTDTPPYCLEHGGKVLNVAVELNGQPPIQVFAKTRSTHELVIRSIDLGVEQHIRSYAELNTFAEPGSPFALAKAAFALAGFLPQFHAESGFRSLEEQLRAFGGGIEISLLAAVPKGSGLGASSILAATVLAALSDLCGLNWDRNVLFTRTLVLEQMLTTGGGWQDQAGAIFREIKLIETPPGLAQIPRLRWLPTQIFGRDHANRSILLYYTGITRLAKNILAEIVRGIFLNSPKHLGIIAEIGANADFAAEAVQSCDYEMLSAAIRNSWCLNQRLDSGTNSPAIQQILDQVRDHLGAAKLLGAGGGGYLLMFAKDETAGLHIRKILAAHAPNPRARFVDFSLSETGLQVTRS